jgi:hypothetical protein
MIPSPITSRAVEAVEAMPVKNNQLLGSFGTPLGDRMNPYVKPIHWTKIDATMNKVPRR